MLNRHIKSQSLVDSCFNSALTGAPASRLVTITELANRGSDKASGHIRERLAAYFLIDCDKEQLIYLVCFVSDNNFL